MAVGFSKIEAEEIIHDITSSVEAVISTVRKVIPDEFPTLLADKIFDGIMKQSRKLSG